MSTLRELAGRLVDRILGAAGRAAIIGSDDEAMLVARPHLAVPGRAMRLLSVNHMAAYPRYL